jgi:hypothetical protein
MKCSKCGSLDTKPYEYKPPHAPSQRHKANCTDACTLTGTFCRSCKFLTP